jgi:ParB family chromosome partitioning protein
MSKGTNKKVGRGLDALLSSQLVTPGHVATAQSAAPAASPTESLNEIPLSEILPNPWQPRASFDEGQLAELADSIRHQGLVQAITVRKFGDQYQLISGERRCRAAKMAGLEAIPAYVREVSDEEMLLHALIENVQRSNLSAIEEAQAYQQMMDELHLTQEEISERVGKKRSTVANFLRLLKLPEEVQQAIREQRISMGHARALINVENPVQQQRLAKKIVAQDLSVRQVEELVKGMSSPPKEEGSVLVQELGDSASDLLYKLVEEVGQWFSGKIGVRQNAQGGAKLTIDLKTSEDVSSAVEKLLRWRHQDA